LGEPLAQRYGPLAQWEEALPILPERTFNIGRKAMRELTSVELETVSGGATAVEYGILAVPPVALEKLAEHFPS